MKYFKVSKDFAVGADVSWLPQMEASGFVFKDKTGKQQDCLETLKSYGLNALRLRIWVNPSDHPLSGHCNAEETLRFALRAKRLSYKIMLNFHYSDSWADPGKQVKPAEWANLGFDDLVQKVYDYTRDTMQFFLDNGFCPEWVQVGNETNPGILLPEGSTVDFDKLTALYNAGHDAIKNVSPQTETIIHLAEANKTAFLVNYFDELVMRNCRYDIIGLSYYPFWLKSPYEETIDDVGNTLKLLPERFGKKVMLVETGGVDEEPEITYNMIVALLEKIVSTDCNGLFYWEPQGARAFTGYALSAWNGDGTPTKAIDAFLTVQTD